jgi:hypothetical protein
MGRTAVVARFVLLALAGIAGTSSAALTREPELVVPADLTVEAPGPSGATVTFTASARGRDNASLPVDCRPASGTRFPLGQTTVTCTAQDRPDEIAIRGFRVTVVDRTAPKLIVPADIRVRTKNRKGAAVTFRASAIDLVDGQVVPVCTPRSSTLFRIGTTRVACTATDRADAAGCALLAGGRRGPLDTSAACLATGSSRDVLQHPTLQERPQDP